MLIDAHTHLNEDHLFENRKTHLQNFQSIGGNILINSGANPLYNERGIHIAHESKNLYPELIVKATVGIHPCDIPENDKEACEIIEKRCKEYPEEIVAIGECGTDLHFPDSTPIEVQQKIFAQQAKIARNLHLPLVIHSRDSFEATYEVLQEYTDLKIYIHSRAYNTEDLHKAEQLIPNLWIGINNIFCYPSAKISREAILQKTSAKLLIETDAPYLPPQHARGTVNTPQNCTFVYQKYQELTGKNRTIIEQEIEQNARNLYNI